MEQQKASAQAAGNPLDDSGLCLLSLDGGGVRGLSSLLVLKGLMDRTNAERCAQGQASVKPFELFDLIGGTSTGGLIAIMLGRLRMDVEECIAAYTSMIKTIFEKPKHTLSVSLRGNVQGRFDSKILMESIKKIVENKGLSATELFNAEGGRSCRVFVCATTYEDTTTVHLRDYTLLDQFNHDRATIVDAALATSAATTFFEPVTIGVRKYVDGALGSNNPVEDVWNEAQSIWCPDDGQLEPMVKCFVSVGTGNPGSTPIKGSVTGFLTDTLKGIAIETERTAEKFAARNRGLLDNKRYFRYNVAQGLQNVGLEEYQKQPEIETVSMTYLNAQCQIFSVRDCARNLRAKQLSTPILFSQEIRMYKDRLVVAAHSPATSTTHSMIPFPSSEEFSGREEYMLCLEKMMSVPDRHNRVALVGLGGIGKTRIALEFALKYRSTESMSIFWVHAGTAPRIEKAYLDIAKKAKIPGWDLEDPKIDKLQLVKDWFERDDSGKWLLVIDNADDIDLLYGGHNYKGDGSSNRLAGYFPRSSNGSILLTTRNKKVGHKFTTGSNVVHITALTIAESESLLAARLGESDSDPHSRAELGNVLERVPLALVQAAAFILAESSSVTAYLKLYSESDISRIQLLCDDFEDDVRDPDIKNPVVATFGISFQQIKKHDLRAANVLSTMSMLDAQAIPKSLLPFDEDPVLFTKALGTLQAYSLITLRNDQTLPKEPQDQMYDLHRLVRLAMRNWLNISNELGIWTANTMITLSKRVPPGTHENRDVWIAYLPHALALLDSDYMQPQNYVSPPAGPLFQIILREGRIAEATLLYKVSQYLNTKGDYHLAEPRVQKSLNLCETMLGSEHQDTLASMGNLASVLNNQGNYEEAEKMHRQVLETRERVLGPEHLNTLTSMNNLAVVLKSQRKYEKAEKMHQQVLKLFERVLGSEHPDTLTSMSNLAGVLDSQGKYEEAERMYQQTLETRERVLGPEHLSTLISMNNLALVLNSQGKYEKAEKMHQQVLKLFERVLGSEHPDTLISMNNLALVLGNQGKYEEAEKMRQQVLKLFEKVLGSEHPNTLTSMSNLALVLDSQSKYEEAEKMHRQVLETRERVLGPEHRGTLINMNKLASVLDSQGKFEEAEKMYRHALETSEKVLGPEHLNTLVSMDNLAGALQNQGKYEEAEKMYRQALETSEKVLGLEHPNTLTIISNLASVLDSQGKYKETEKICRQELETIKRMLGPEHPHTLTSMDNLASVLDSQGKYEEAERMYRQALETRERVLGPEHPSTLSSKNNLALVLGNQDKHEEAEKMYRHALETCEKVLGSEHSDTLIIMNNLALMLKTQQVQRGGENALTRVEAV